MSDSQERFHVRMEGDRPVRLTVAEMTPDEALAAVAFLAATSGAQVMVTLSV